MAYISYEIFSEDFESGAFCKLCDHMIKKIENGLIYLELDDVRQTKEKTIFGKMFYVDNGDLTYTIKSYYANFKLECSSIAKEIMDIYKLNKNQRKLLISGKYDYKNVLNTIGI